MKNACAEATKGRIEVRPNIFATGSVLLLLRRGGGGGLNVLADGRVEGWELRTLHICLSRVLPS
jgi:hypothetical protein